MEPFKVVVVTSVRRIGDDFSDGSVCKNGTDVEALEVLDT